MELLVKRYYRNLSYSIGKMFINGEYFCDVLEDVDRNLKDSDDVERIKKIKVYKETAIPLGRYKVILSYSNRFKKILPEILNVKGFEGIRIHAGNTKADTSGCILVGKNNIKGAVVESRKTMNALMEILTKANDNGEEIFINVTH